MKVVELIKKAGAKAGLIQVDQDVKSIEIKIVEMRSISLQELHSQSESLEELQSAPAELTVSFDQIYQALNLPAPAHGWNTTRVLEMLASDELKSKSPQEAAQAILVAMGQNQAPPEDILKDALTRDKALDSYEEFVTKKVQHREGERKKAKKEIAEQIRNLEKQAGELEKAQARDEKSLEDWRTRKIAEEEQLARAASLFVQDHGITVSKKNQK